MSFNSGCKMRHAAVQPCMMYCTRKRDSEVVGEHDGPAGRLTGQTVSAVHLPDGWMGQRQLHGQQRQEPRRHAGLQADAHCQRCYSEVLALRSGTCPALQGDLVLQKLRVRTPDDAIATGQGH